MNKYEGVYRLRRVAILFGLTLVLLGSLVAQPVLAGTVGYVDFEFLFNNHPEYEMKTRNCSGLLSNSRPSFRRKLEPSAKTPIWTS